MTDAAGQFLSDVFDFGRGGQLPMSQLIIKLYRTDIQLYKLVICLYTRT